MPCYNVEKYIADAIESVLAQTFTNWELRIVDDCSTDSTYAIAQKYAQKDSRISLERMAENTGAPSIPRNRAIMESSATWIHALDADDYIDKDSLEILYRRAVETNADCVFQTFISVTEDRQVLPIRLPASDFNFSQVLSGDDACRLTLCNWKINANGGLFKKSHYLKAIAENKVKDCAHSDEIQTRLLLWNCHRVAFSDTIYWRRENPFSITRNFNINRLSYLPPYSYLCDLVRERYPSDIEIQKETETYLFFALNSIALPFMRNYYSFSRTERQTMHKGLKECWSGIRWNYVRQANSTLKRYLYSCCYSMYLFSCILRILFHKY